MAPFPIATRSQVPYFFNRLCVLSPPAMDLPPPPSESDFLLLAERADPLRVSLGPLASSSLRVNLCPPVSELIDGGPLERGPGECSMTGVEGALFLSFFEKALVTEAATR